MRNRTKHLVAFAGSLIAGSLLQNQAPAEMPIPADSIVESIGINVHLHYTDTPYADFPLVQSLLTDLGVRHIRDGLIDTTWDEFYKRHNALGQKGIHCIFVTSPQQSDSLLAVYPAKMAATFEGYEAPNEYNQSNDPKWADTLRSFLPKLDRIVHQEKALKSTDILVGPSLTQPAAYAQVQGLQQFFDYSNMHNYLAGRNPGTSGWGGGGYGSIDWNEQLVHGAWGDKPVMTTETGFNTDPDNKQSVPEEVQGKYMPRLILEQLLHHVQRTYIYELIDVGPQVSKNDAQFGLARHDGSKKPAFAALKQLIEAASDPRQNPTLKDLPYALSGNTSDVHHLLAQRGDGTYLLFFWVEKPAFDQQTRKQVQVQPQALTLSTKEHLNSVELITANADGTASTQHLKNAGSIPLRATDSISVLRIAVAQAASSHHRP